VNEKLWGGHFLSLLLQFGLHACLAGSKTRRDSVFLCIQYPAEIPHLCVRRHGCPHLPQTNIRSGQWRGLYINMVELAMTKFCRKEKQLGYQVRVWWIFLLYLRIFSFRKCPLSHNIDAVCHLAAVVTFFFFFFFFFFLSKYNWASSIMWLTTLMLIALQIITV